MEDVHLSLQQEINADQSNGSSHRHTRTGGAVNKTNSNQTLLAECGVNRWLDPLMRLISDLMKPGLAKQSGTNVEKTIVYNTEMM